MGLEGIVSRFSPNKREKIAFFVVVTIGLFLLIYGCSKPVPAPTSAASVTGATSEQPPAETAQPVQTKRRTRTINSHYWIIPVDLGTPGADPSQAHLDAEEKFEKEHPKLMVLSVSPFGEWLEIYTQPCGC
jgi:hypothetical protein